VQQLMSFHVGPMSSFSGQILLSPARPGPPLCSAAKNSTLQRGLDLLSLAWPTSCLYMAAWSRPRHRIVVMIQTVR